MLFLPLKAQCIFLLIDVGLDHLINFGRGNINRYKESRSFVLNRARIVGLVFISQPLHERNLPRLFHGSWEDGKDMWNRVSPRWALLQWVNHPGLWAKGNYCYFKLLSLEMHCNTDTEMGTDKWGVATTYTYILVYIYTNIIVYINSIIYIIVYIYNSILYNLYNSIYLYILLAIVYTIANYSIV